MYAKAASLSGEWGVAIGCGGAFGIDANAHRGALAAVDVSRQTETLLAWPGPRLTKLLSSGYPKVLVSVETADVRGRAPSARASLTESSKISTTLRQWFRPAVAGIAYAEPAPARFN